MPLRPTHTFPEGSYAERLHALDVPMRLWPKPISTAIWIAVHESVDELRRAVALARAVGFIVPARWPKKKRARNATGSNEPVERGAPAPLVAEEEAESRERWKRTFALLLAVARALVLKAIDGDLKASAEIARRLEGGTGPKRHGPRLVGAAPTTTPPPVEDLMAAERRRVQVASLAEDFDAPRPSA